MAMVASSLVCQSTLSRAKISPNKWAFKNSSMAGANSYSLPETGAPISLVWFAAPYSRALPVGFAPGRAPASSLLPRASVTYISVVKAFKLRGKPQ